MLEIFLPDVLEWEHEPDPNINTKEIEKMRTRKNCSVRPLSIVARLKIETTAGEIFKVEAPALFAGKVADEYGKRKDIRDVSVANVICGEGWDIGADLLIECMTCPADLQKLTEQLEDSELAEEDGYFIDSLIESEGGIEEACNAYELYHDCIRFFQGWTFEEVARAEYGDYWEEDPDDDADRFDEFMYILQDKGYEETKWGVIFVDR